VLTVGGLPLGFGGGAPLKNAESDARIPPDVLPGWRAFLFAEVLPGGLPRLAVPLLDEALRVVLAYVRVLPLAPGSRFLILPVSVIFGIIALMI
jgi:hypothetical protein